MPRNAGFDESRVPPRPTPATTGRAQGKSATRARRPRVAMPSDQRWRDIVDAAAVVFQKKGYEAATTADIADAVGMLKGSLYYYIQKKEDLLFAVIQDVHEAFLVNHVYCRRVEGDALTRMRAFIEGHVAVNAREAVRSTVFYRDFHSLSAERQAFIIAERDQYDQFLRDLIREGQQEGAFCPDLDPKITSIGVLAMMNHVFQWYRPDGQLSPEDVGRRYADLLMGGLVCPGDSHSPGHRSELGRLRPGTRPAAARRAAREMPSPMRASSKRV